jgi:hypothetical protein
MVLRVQSNTSDGCDGAVTHGPTHEYCNIILPSFNKTVNNVAVGNLVSCHDAYLTLMAIVSYRTHIYYCHKMMNLLIALP